jgi:hypothetical protein
MSDDPKPKTAFDAVSDKRSVEFFRASPEEALSGSRLSSAEADPGADRSRAIISLAVEQPERFLELVGYLPHAIQDIFFQYYLLGRTQTQIGSLLGMSQTGVWQALRLGIEAICAVILSGGEPPDLRFVPSVNAPLHRKAYDAYQAMLEFETKAEARGMLRIDSPRNLGEFILRVDDETLEVQFAPSTTDGPVSRESSC